MKRLSIIILFLFILATGCIYMPAPAGTTGGQQPVITKFEASPDSITAGSRAQLIWEVTGATTVSIDNGIGAVALKGSRTVLPSATTSYEMTATNQYGTTRASTQVIVTGSTVGTPSAGYPTINSFVASPTIIPTGGSSTLSWNVSGAVQVNISGIGNVDNAGSQSVSPATTTSYTLTATASNGSWVSQTIMVVVTSSAPPSAGQPDLIVQNISKVETASGYYIIGFRLKNIGTGNAGASICRLFAEGVQKSNANVPAIAAGATYDGTFPDWPYSPLTPNIKVVAEASGIISESDETNNEKSVTMAITVAYDLKEQAPTATWKSGAGSLAFGGSTGDASGFACHRTNVTLEDNNLYSKVLQTHPQWVDNGYITGTYPLYTVKTGDCFYARIGFIKGATAGKVTCSLNVVIEGDGPIILPVSYTKSYDGSMKSFYYDLSSFAGKKVWLKLTASADGSSGQDWIVWEQARVIR